MIWELSNAKLISIKLFKLFVCFLKITLSTPIKFIVLSLEYIFYALRISKISFPTAQNVDVDIQDTIGKIVHFIEEPVCIKAERKRCKKMDGKSDSSSQEKLFDPSGIANRLGWYNYSLFLFGKMHFLPKNICIRCHGFRMSFLPKAKTIPNLRINGWLAGMDLNESNRIGEYWSISGPHSMDCWPNRLAIPLGVVSRFEKVFRFSLSPLFLFFFLYDLCPICVFIIHRMTFCRCRPNAHRINYATTVNRTSSVFAILRTTFFCCQSLPFIDFSPG